MITRGVLPCGLALNIKKYLRAKEEFIFKYLKAKEELWTHIQIFHHAKI
jgi:hypothetical protein